MTVNVAFYHLGPSSLARSHIHLIFHVIDDFRRRRYSARLSHSCVHSLHPYISHIVSNFASHPRRVTRDPGCHLARIDHVAKFPVVARHIPTRASNTVRPLTSSLEGPREVAAVLECLCMLHHASRIVNASSAPFPSILQAAASRAWVKTRPTRAYHGAQSSSLRAPVVVKHGDDSASQKSEDGSAMPAASCVFCTRPCISCTLTRGKLKQDIPGQPSAHGK